jgi:hypothetical protein
MNITIRMSAFSAVTLASQSLSVSAPAQQAPNLTFFVTSVGIGKGGDLGGLAGADKHCQDLAQAVGAGNRNWRAYLSTQASGGRAAVNARDRIGRGPWQNAKGVVVAPNVDVLHGDNKLTKETALNEKGDVVNGRGDRPNMHDALTGTQMNGTAFPAAEDRTCGNWTKSSGTGAAMLGHIDRQGLGDTVQDKSWNAAHPSRGSEGGCSQSDLRSTGGAGLFYCFATN